MNELTTGEYMTCMERLSQLSWPMTLGSFTRIAPELGWHFTGHQYSFTADFVAGTREVMVIDNREGDVRSISFILAKPSLEGIDLRAALNDYFIHYVTSASQAWGNPIRAIPEKNPMIAWPLPSDGIAEVTRNASKVYTTFLTPQGTPPDSIYPTYYNH